MSAKTMQNSELHELLITRTFDAPQWLVWQAWTEPEHLMQWCCPDGFTLLFCEGELRVGGNWRSAMRSPQGEKFVMSGTYREIAPCQRLVFTHAWEEGNAAGPETVATVHLAEHAGRTTMTFWQTGFESVESRDGHEGGWSQAFDHLGQHLQQTISTTPRELTLTRIFDAPLDLVWKAWTDPGHVAQWWGPHGFTAPLCEWDAQPGNAILVHMHGPKGSQFDFDMPMGGVFLEVSTHKRLVFISNAMADETGEPQLEVRNVVTFEDMKGKTKVTLQATVLKSTPAVAGAVAGMEQGWTQSLEKLGLLLERT